MPKDMQYSAGSVIYFRGDEADKIWLIKDGTVMLIYDDLISGKEVHDQLAAGEFLGVRASMGHYPREEDAIVGEQDISTIMFSLSEFEALASASHGLVMKMLKVFSNQLRRIHRQVANLMNDREPYSPEIGLYNVGDYYLINKRFSQAQYVFERFLILYPQSIHASQAAKKLKEAQEGVARYGLTRNIPSKVDLSNPVNELKSIEWYRQAQEAMAEKKYNQAYLLYKKIIDARENEEYSIKSYFEIGKCFFFLGKFNECIKYCSQLIEKYPQSPTLTEQNSSLVDALFLIGQSYEVSKQPKQAWTYYTKILTLVPDPANEMHVRVQECLDSLAEPQEA
ncbi:MAG: tetratricopeptide repeat protein [Spirochaetaceae bacterium]|jgi:CRP-like cAMP-binding protein|nr:tetratricopeptide repeat protein [Spirochaetaceae bacterium]